MASISDQFCGNLAVLFCNYSSPPIAKKGAEIHFANTRAVDKVTYSLFELGFLAKSTADGKHWPFKMIVDSKDLLDLTKNLEMMDNGKQKFLTNVICFAGDCLDTPVTRQWFSVEGTSRHLMNVMSDFGYATAQRGEFQWTENIKTSMRDAYFWDDMGRSVDDGPLAFPYEK